MAGTAQGSSLLIVSVFSVHLKVTSLRGGRRRRQKMLEL